ncbi:hypothetical protein DZF91_16515 [Actinomadura logoneensis]|uniref:Uncharacterized protein n=1 Tax=Actinomadura logoneensis TaxID=2293572 RepID=A0A372JMI8_9ACTN|nr:hypothetical protein [Actinomadura logoneensis]RFU40568.1 hypothetical protein DZF91_16515 [Actinomadura logoneensis]
MPPLDPVAARPAGAVLFVLLGSVQFLLVPDGFQHAPYVGVCLILAVLMSFGGAAGFLAEASVRVWWYALAEGVANVLGVTGTAVWGLPLVDACTGACTGAWTRWTHPVLLLMGAALAALSAWAVHSRLHHHRAGSPVTSARERRHRPPRRPRRQRR